MIVSSEAEVERPRQRVPPAVVALFAPDTGMDLQARIGRARFAFLAAMVCALLAAFAQAYRVDTRTATLKNLEKAGQLDNMSDRQVEDETTKSNRLYEVGRVALGAGEAPVFLGLGSLAVLGLVWFTRGKVKGRAVVPVAAAVLLPGALANVLDAISAWQHAALPPKDAMLAPRTISAIAAVFGHPLAGPWLKVGNVFDFFSLWAAILMGYGVAAAGDVPVRRALWTTLVAWLCWRLITTVPFGG
ncbi:MAG: hypothetical protein ABR567_06595 [Myxococcales bacterium]